MFSTVIRGSDLGTSQFSDMCGIRIVFLVALTKAEPPRSMGCNVAFRGHC